MHKQSTHNESAICTDLGSAFLVLIGAPTESSERAQALTCHLAAKITLLKRQGV